MDGRVVHVEKKKVLRNLRANQKIHNNEYETALRGWTDQMTEALKFQLGEISKSGKVDIPFLYKLKRPEHHTKEYDIAIGMLEMETRDVVELSETDYRQFFEDEWGWKENWDLSNSRYMVK